MLCTNQKSSSFSQRKITLSLDFSAEPWNDKYGLLLKKRSRNYRKFVGKARERSQTNHTNKFNKFISTKPNVFFISQNLVAFRGSILPNCDNRPPKSQ